MTVLLNKKPCVLVEASAGMGADVWMGVKGLLVGCATAANEMLTIQITIQVDVLNTILFILIPKEYRRASR